MIKKPGVVIDNRFKFSKDQQNDIFDDFARFRALWLSKLVDQTGWPWDYTLFNPLVFSTLRSFVARTATGQIGINLQAWNEEERPKTKINQSLVEWEFQEVELQLKLSKAIFSAGLYGKGFLETGWFFEKERSVEEEDDKGNVQRKFMIAPKINRADLANLRVYDLFVANRNIAELQKQPWIIIRRYRTIAELQKINDMRGGDVYDLKQVKDKGKDLFVRFVDYGRDVMYTDNSDIPFENGVLETLEMWDGEEGKVYESVRNHREIVIREEDNPFYHNQYPIADITFFPQDDEFWTTGLVRPMEDLQMGMNAIFNQYLTNARQQMNNMWITGDVRIPDWEFISRPNGVIHVVGNIDQIKEVQHKDITGQAQTMMNTLKDDINRTTGINDYLAMGTPDKGKKGAAALELEENNLDQNLKLFMAHIEQKTVKELTKQFLAMNKQYITSDQTIRIAGRHGYKNAEIKPDDVSAAFDPIVIPNSSIPKNPMVRAQNLEALMQMAKDEQKVQINTSPIWKELISSMGLTDLDEIVPDDRDEALEENDMLIKGIDVEVEVSDNHQVHKTVHQFALISQKLDQAATKRIVEHIKQHDLWQLAQDPNLIDKLTGNPQIPNQPTTTQQQPQIGQGQQQPPQPGQQPQLQSPATGVQSLVQQRGQALSLAGQPQGLMPQPPTQ